jgi:GxxExxY protein
MNMNKGKILYPEESYKLQGIVFEVYREMGCGFLESVYQECMEKELAAGGIPFESQKELRLQYKGNPLQQTYKTDLWCFDSIVVELKAVKEILPEHRAQLMNYLKASGMKLGFLVNFGHHPKVEIERFVL